MQLTSPDSQPLLCISEAILRLSNVNLALFVLAGRVLYINHCKHGGPTHEVHSTKLLALVNFSSSHSFSHTAVLQTRWEFDDATV